MSMFSTVSRPRWLAFFFLGVVVLAAADFLAPNALAQPDAPAPAPAAAPADEPKPGGNPLIEFLLTSVTGWVLNLIYLVFFAMLVWLFLDLRGPNLMPVDFIEMFEDAMNKRKFKEAFEMAKADNSMIGKALTAGMTRLQHGLSEARDAALSVIDSTRARKDHVIGYIAIIGTLGPLIGLVGTVSGMIDSFGVLARTGTANAAQLAGGISHALNATLVGILLSCLAIPAYSFYRNRLSRVTIDVTLMTDDLLTQMYHSSRRPATPGADGTTKAATAGATAPAAS